jgi:hypothetical protein
VAKAYQDKSGNTVVVKYGPSGTSKDEIAGGPKADVFASANMGHPEARLWADGNEWCLARGQSLRAIHRIPGGTADFSWLRILNGEVNRPAPIKNPPVPLGRRPPKRNAREREDSISRR